MPKRFFHLPGLYRGTGYCFGSCSEVCTCKKHVRPLKSRLRKGGGWEEESGPCQELRGGWKGNEGALYFHLSPTHIYTHVHIYSLSLSYFYEHYLSLPFSLFYEHSLSLSFSLCLFLSYVYKYSLSLSIFFFFLPFFLFYEHSLSPSLSFSFQTWLVSTKNEERGRTANFRTRQPVRRGNRWMGLAAYPANAPTGIAV